MKFMSVAAIAAALVCAAPLAMADEITTERVQFERGKTGTTVSGRIKGYDTMHYLVGAKAGQAMDVDLETRNTSTYFNVFAPGKVPGQDGALFIGDTGGNRFSGSLPDSGDYLIQVYLYRNAARRGDTARFKLNISIAADQGAGEGNQGDAKVPGTEFNATGQIPCARNAGQPMGQCDFGVVREGNGNGAITVFWPDGGNRVIFFEMNTPSSFDQSQADGDVTMTVGQNSDLYMVTIGDQRFEIFEAIMTGG